MNFNYKAVDSFYFLEQNRWLFDFDSDKSNKEKKGYKKLNVEECFKK